MNKIVLIAGPTCSGKSQAAIEVAERLGGVVINADSMQVYREIPILSAQPTQEDQNRVPHYLFGHKSVLDDYSVGHWLEEIRTVIRDQLSAGKVPVVAGGTGLYFQALKEGLAEIPPIPEFVRDYVRGVMGRWGLDAVRDRLAAVDLLNRADLDNMDRQRASRALEVRLATGRSLSSWQKAGQSGGFDGEAFVPIVLAPPRQEIYRRCDDRFDQMLKRGALNEVKQLLPLELPHSRPAMKALGVPHLSRYLEGEMPLDEAVDKAKTATRRYAKRQFTWISGHMISWSMVFEQDSEYILEKIFSIIKENGLTMR